MAAYLCQDGECERAFAAGIISLAAQGYLRIYASGEQFRVVKVGAADHALAAEEAGLLAALFPANSADCEFSGIDPGSLEHALSDFEEAINGIACPDLLSQHTIFWIMGIAFSLMYVPLFASETLSVSRAGTPLASLLYLCIWIVLGAVCLVAALRLWPATLRKVISRLPGINRPRVRFKYSDAIPIFLTMSACLGFGLLAAETSAIFACLIGMIIIIGSISRHLLEVPTREGRMVLAELRDFKEFLMRTEADRLSRAAQSQEGQLLFEKYSAYAVAMEIERGCGEEFASELIQTLEFDRAYSFNFLPEGLDEGGPSGHFLQLNLRREPENMERAGQRTS